MTKTERARAIVVELPPLRDFVTFSFPLIFLFVMFFHLFVYYLKGKF